MTWRDPNRGNVRRSGLLAIEVAFLYVASAAVGGTGIVYAWFRYLATPVDPFAVAASPWQPLVQHLHIVLAPLLVFATGAVWRSHVLASWRINGVKRRPSGLFLVVSIVPMVASGYFVQIVQEDSWRRAWGIVHTAVSVAWMAGSTVHFFSRRQRARLNDAAPDPDQALPAAREAVSLPSPVHQNATRTPS